MKKNYIKPEIKAHKIVTSTMICGSNDPMVTSTQAGENSTGLSKFDFWEDEDE